MALRSLMVRRLTWLNGRWHPSPAPHLSPHVAGMQECTRTEQGKRFSHVKSLHKTTTAFPFSLLYPGPIQREMVSHILSTRVNASP